jgi:hypothetical protein
MDKTGKYRQLIKNILTQYHELVSKQPQAGVDSVLSFDDEHDQYLWLQTGWSNRHRVHGITVHTSLHNGKIYVEQDWTEDGIATDLVRAGVPREDIVLAFHEPEVRKMTEFAVA